MPYVTPDLVAEARTVDLFSFLQSTDPQSLVKCGSDEYCTKEHDSLKISHGKWFWWSHGIGGHTALDYLIRVRGMRLPDAVEILAGTSCAMLPPPRAAPPQPEKRLMKLLHNDSCDRVRRYLTGRGLDAEIVDRMISEGRIAEEKDHGFALFYGFDERGKPRFVPSQDGLARIRDFRNFLQMVFVEEPHEFWILHIVETERNMEIELGHIFEFVVSAIAFPDDFAQGNVGLADNIVEIDIDGHRRESGRYSTVTDFARFRGWSIGSPRKRAM